MLSTDQEREEFRTHSRWLAELYQAESNLDSDGLRQHVIELESDSSVLPPTRPGFRGAIGAVIIKAQAAAFWWLVRAFRMRDRAFRSVHTTFVRQSRMRDAREHEMLQRINDLELRLRDLERRLVRP